MYHTTLSRSLIKIRRINQSQSSSSSSPKKTTTMDSTTYTSNARTPCVKGCGFYGSQETKNMCSMCYNHFLKTHLIDQTAKAAENLSLSETRTSSSPSIVSSISGPETFGSGSDSGSIVKSRCRNCNKKVGLLGFKCRCGDLFCSMHRHPTEHSCTFDYKTFDREILIKENPLISGDKLAGRI